MNPTSLVGLALLGLAPAAHAADIDEIATSDISEAAPDAPIDGAARERARTARSSGKRTVTRGSATGPHGNTVRHVEATYGGRTVEATRVATDRGVVGHREVTGPHGRSVERNAAYARPAPARPGGPVVHPTPGRPGTTVVHPTPGRPGAVVVHRPPAATVRPTVVHGARAPGLAHVAGPRVRTVRYAHVHPYHGVFVYGPRPATHVTYVDGGGPVEVARADLPERQVDRTDTLAIGVVGGSLVSGSPLTGQLYGDPGLGLVGRYRPAEMVGLELGVTHHAATLSLDEKRTQTQVGGQVMLFAFPWARVSPYALGGVTFNAANVQAQISETETLQSVDGQWGLDGGLGVELALGNNFALDFEGKYIGWLDERYEGEAPGAFQATAGMLLHFR